MSHKQRENRMRLPFDEAAHPTRSVHNGRHVDTHHQRLAAAMNNAVARGTREGWTQPQYRAELENILAADRQGLRRGEIELNDAGARRTREAAEGRLQEAAAKAEKSEPPSDWRGGLR